jgi:hypothetical protein
MSTSLFLTVTWLLPLALFLLWYGGRGRPLSAQELEGFMAELGRDAQSPQQAALLAEVRTLAANDDGREFVMQNLARYRDQAAYPPGHEHLGPSARAADQRYGRRIIPHLLRYGNVPVFIARRVGSFIEPAGGAEPWHYVAMVRYRSRRDFLRFACAISRHDIAMHKWAALESTHVFPVHPVLSLIAVRAAVAVLLLALALALRVAGMGI